MIDRRHPPSGSEPRTFPFPAFLRQRLENGLQVIVARRPRLPLATVELVSPSGIWHDPPELAGLTTLHAGLLDEGTQARTAHEIALAVEQLGGYLGSGAGWNATVVEASGLAEHLPALLGLVAEVALIPSFPVEEIERARKRRLAELLRRRSQPSIVADESFQREIYGATPYGRPQLGDESSVRAVHREALLDFYREHFLVGGSACIAVGDLDPERTLERIADSLREWPQGVAPARPEVRPRELEAPRVVLVDRPEAQQTELRIGHPGVAKDDPDRPVISVLNAILGGKFTSRINLNLRERNGYTYGANSRFSPRLGPGPFLVSTAVANDVAGAAASEVVYEIERIRNEPVAPDELEDAIRYLLGVFPYTLQTVAGLVKRFEELAIYDLPDDYHDRYLEAIRSVRREQVQEVARKHLHPSRLTLLTCGPAAELIESFRRFAEPEVIPDRFRDPQTG